MSVGIYMNALYMVSLKLYVLISECSTHNIIKMRGFVRLNAVYMLLLN